MARRALLLFVGIALLSFGSAGAVSAQPKSTPALALSPRWLQPAEPVHIVGPVYFVGTEGLAAYLFATPEGLILLDGGMPQSAGDITASIRRLGFRPEEIRLILLTHAHVDHVGTVAHFKALSGAEVVVMDREAGLLASGGRADPVYGGAESFRFPPVKADRTITDGDSVSLGGVILTARLGAGHTRGSTTWITTVEDGGRAYTVVFPCCTTAPASYRFLKRPSYPGIAEDYARTFEMLGSFMPDIWLGAHTEAFGFRKKAARAATDGVNAWIDPDGYRRMLAADKAKVEARIARER